MNKQRLAVPTGLPWPFDFSILTGGLATDVSRPFSYHPGEPRSNVWRTSCELSVGCPSGPGRGSWSCDASAILRRTG